MWLECYQSCVAPFRVFSSLRYVITDISNVILSQFSAALALGACVQLCRLIGTHCSKKTSSHTFVVFPNYQEDETLHRETLEKSWPLSFSRETHAHGVGDGPSRGGNWQPPSRMWWPTIIRLELPKRLVALHPTPSGPFRHLLWKKQGVDLTGATSPVCS